MGALLSMLGGGLGAFGSYMGGMADRRSAEYNAAIMEQKAELSRQASERETEMMHDQGRRLKAEQVAAYGKSGAVLTSGTPLSVLAEQSAKMERDVLEQRRNRMIEQQQLKSQAEMLRYQGKMASRAGLFGATSSLLGGAAQAGGMF